MIKFIKNYFEHRDERGLIKGLINFGCWEEINIIESDRGVIRGNHYHKKTQEVFIILKGKIRVSLQRVENNSLVGKIDKYIVKKGDIFLVEKNVMHSFEVLQKSIWINILSKRIDKKRPDIFRL